MKNESRLMSLKETLAQAKTDRKKNLNEISMRAFERANEEYKGYCSTCKKFTRPNTEPDARKYDCPKCKKNTVYGAEEALMMGLISLSEGRNSRKYGEEPIDAKAFTVEENPMPESRFAESKNLHGGKLNEERDSRGIHMDEDGTYPAYAWPGGYPVYYIMKDNGVLCPDCVNNERPKHLDDEYPDDDQWIVAGQDINYEDADLYCDHCNEKIECAYCEDEDNEEENEEIEMENRNIKGRKLNEEREIKFRSLNEMWSGPLQDEYSDFEEFEAYDEMYNLSGRLGFDSAKEAWEANPVVKGSTDPNDYGLESEGDHPDINEIESEGSLVDEYPVDESQTVSNAGDAKVYSYMNHMWEIITWNDEAEEHGSGSQTVNDLGVQYDETTREGKRLRGIDEAIRTNGRKLNERINKSTTGDITMKKANLREKLLERLGNTTEGRKLLREVEESKNPRNRRGRKLNEGIYDEYDQSLADDIDDMEDDYGEAQCPECGGFDVRQVMIPDNVGKGMHEGYWCHDCNEEVSPNTDSEVDEGCDGMDECGGVQMESRNRRGRKLNENHIGAALRSGVPIIGGVDYRSSTAKRRSSYEVTDEMLGGVVDQYGGIRLTNDDIFAEGSYEKNMSDHVGGMFDDDDFVIDMNRLRKPKPSSSKSTSPKPLHEAKFEGFRREEETPEEEFDADMDRYYIDDYDPEGKENEVIDGPGDYTEFDTDEFEEFESGVEKVMGRINRKNRKPEVRKLRPERERNFKFKHRD